MLKVIYTEENPIADSKALEYAKNIIYQYQNNILNSDFIINENITNISVSNEIVIDAFRICIKRGYIHHKDICFGYKNIEIYSDKTGYLDEWPEGFCDAYMNFLDEFLN